jgi:hypothetical protein
MDWLLFARTLRAEGRRHQLTLVVVALIVSSSDELGRRLSARLTPDVSPVALAYILSMAVATMSLVVAWMTGHSQRLAAIEASLTGVGYSRRARFAARKCASLFGTNALPMLLVSMPVFFRWLRLGGPHRVFLGFALLWLLQSAVPSLFALTALLRPGLLYLAAALGAIGWLAFGHASDWLTPALWSLLESLPPALFVTTVVGANPGRALVLLLSWIAVAWVGEYVCAPGRLLRRSSSGRVWGGGVATVVQRTAMPAPLRAQLWRVIVTLSRLRRFQVGWLLAVVGCTALGLRAASAPGDSRLGYLFPLLPSILLSFSLTNALGTDAAGVPLFSVLPRSVFSKLWPASEIGAGLLAGLAVVPGLAAYVYEGGRSPSVLVGVAFSAVLWLWVGALGRITSVLFPLPLSVRRVSGQALPAASAVVVSVAALAFGAPYLLLVQRLEPGTGVGAHVGLGVLLVAALVGRRALLRISRVLHESWRPRLWTPDFMLQAR